MGRVLEALVHEMSVVALPLPMERCPEARGDARDAPAGGRSGSAVTGRQAEVSHVD